MSATALTLLGGAAIGLAAGSSMIPLTRRQLAAAVARTGQSPDAATEVAGPIESMTPVAPWQRGALMGASALLPGLVLYRVGWSFNALPPLLLLLGLIQLAYCDLSRKLLPKPLVYAISAPVLASGLAIAIANNEWVRFEHAAIGAAIFFGALFVMNLLNPRWIAFGDVRLAGVVGFGLTWIAPYALLEGFCLANVLAAVVGLTLIALRRADRKSALPFGLYLAVGAALTIVAWS